MDERPPETPSSGSRPEAELRAAAEERGIELTEEQAQAFMSAEADGDCVGLEAFLNSVDGSVEGIGQCDWTCYDFV